MLYMWHVMLVMTQDEDKCNLLSTYSMDHTGHYLYESDLE